MNGADQKAEVMHRHKWSNSKDFRMMCAALCLRVFSFVAVPDGGRWKEPIPMSLFKGRNGEHLFMVTIPVLEAWWQKKVEDFCPLWPERGLSGPPVPNDVGQWEPACEARA